MSAAAESTKAAPRPATIAWGFVAAAFGAQLAAAYFDNVRGPLLPQVAAELHLEYTESGAFLAVCQVAATLATLALIGALNKWSERTVLVAVCVLAILAGILAPAVHGMGLLLVLAALLGSSISGLGTMANVMVVEGTPLTMQARVMAGLHSMYGFGSMLGAAVVGAALAAGGHWSWIYAGATPVFIALAAFGAWRLPRRATHEERTVQPARLSGGQWLIVFTFSMYVAGEVTTSMWLTSFLVREHGIDISAATPYVTGFFLTMAISRVACALLIRPQYEALVLRLALLVPIGVFLVGYFGHLPLAFSLTGLFGPFFPVFLSRQSRRFPDRWRSITIWTMVAMSVTIGACNFLLGRAADMVGLRTAYLFPPVLLAVAFGLLMLVLAGERRS